MPRDGDRRLHSAITLIPGRRKRGGERRRARRLRVSLGLNRAPPTTRDRSNAERRADAVAAARTPPAIIRTPLAVWPTPIGRCPESRLTGGSLQAVLQRRCLAGDEQRGGRIEQHDVAARTAFAVEQPLDHRCVLRSRTARQRLAIARRQAHVRRMHIERVHRAVDEFGHLRVTQRGNLVQATGAVHDPGALGAKERPAFAPRALCAPDGTRR